MRKSFLVHIFTKNVSIYVKPRPGWAPPLHHLLYVSSNTMHQRKCAIFETTSRQQHSSGSVAVRCAVLGGCLVSTQPWSNAVLSVRKTLFSRQLWTPVRQTMQQVTQPVGNRTAKFCAAVNGPIVLNNLSCSGVLDSSLAGYKRTLKTHLFTLERQQSSTGAAVTL